MDRFLNRRLFLKLGGLSVALSVTDPALARRLATGERRVEDLPGRARRPSDQRSTPTLVTIFLRGGADGLNIVPPTESGEHATYRGFRPGLSVALASMQSAGTVLTDGSGVEVGWGLNPRMDSLLPVWQAGSLAILPDVHYDNGSRSHFDSQQFYENGTPWNKFTPEGWANRYLTVTDGDPLLRAIAFDTITPFAMSGSYPTLTFSGLGSLNVSLNTGRDQRFLDTQEAAYPTLLDGPAVHDREVAQAGSDLVAAIRAIRATTLPTPDPAVDALYPSTANGGVGPQGRHGYFGDRMRDLASLIKSNAFSIEIAEVDLFSWDTHDAQLTAANNHPDLCEALARGLRAFHDDLGDFMENVVVLVMSEFGRTARENGSGGTDHGSATTFFVMGPPTKVLGRRIVHGAAGYRGLSDLRDNRDLKHSTDYRSVIAEVLDRHMGASSPGLFPGFTPAPAGVMA
jgi:uncharacterized protein (DUF1501 family)